MSEKITYFQNKKKRHEERKVPFNNVGTYRRPAEINTLFSK